MKYDIAIRIVIAQTVVTDSRSCNELHITTVFKNIYNKLRRSGSAHTQFVLERSCPAMIADVGAGEINNCRYSFEGTFVYCLPMDIPLKGFYRSVFCFPSEVAHLIASLEKDFS